MQLKSNAGKAIQEKNVESVIPRIYDTYSRE